MSFCFVSLRAVHDVVVGGHTAKVAYVTNDHLGSPRINTYANGLVTPRDDYHPFGKEILTAQRTIALEYAATGGGDA